MSKCRSLTGLRYTENGKTTHVYHSSSPYWNRSGKQDGDSTQEDAGEAVKLLAQKDRISNWRLPGNCCLPPVNEYLGQMFDLKNALQDHATWSCWRCKTSGEPL